MQPLGMSTTSNPMLSSSSNYKLSDATLVSKQREVIKLQDDAILDIEKGVERMHGKVRDN